MLGRYKDSMDAMNRAFYTVALLAAGGGSKMVEMCETIGIPTTPETLKEASKRPLIVFDIDDTLLRNDSSIIPDVFLLYKKLRALGARTFLVTARRASMRNFTVDELNKAGIEFERENLFICPENYRSSMTSVSQWKALMRRNIAFKYGAPISLSVGDQWGDITELDNDYEIDYLDEAYGVKHKPFLLMRIGDARGATCVGLKLPSSD